MLAPTPSCPFLELSSSGAQTLVLQPSRSPVPAHLGDRDSLACPFHILLGTDHLQTRLALEGSSCAHWLKLPALSLCKLNAFKHLY